jgi:hypothetical protein
MGGPRSAGIDRLEADGAPALGSAAELLADWNMPPPSGTESAAPGAESENVGRRIAAALGAELGLDRGEQDRKDRGSAVAADRGACDGRA